MLPSGTGIWALVNQHDLALETENYLSEDHERSKGGFMDVDVVNVNGITKGCMEITPPLITYLLLENCL